MNSICSGQVQEIKYSKGLSKNRSKMCTVYEKIGVLEWILDVGFIKVGHIQCGH